MVSHAIDTHCAQKHLGEQATINTACQRYRCTRFLASALALLLSCSADAAECLRYSEEVTLRGVLSRHTFAEQPNYESIAHGDAKASYFFITPAKQFCVAKGKNGGEFEPAEAKVKTVQLLLAANDYDRLRQYLGSKVVCLGTFVHRFTGHHHSLVLLENAKCRP